MKVYMQMPNLGTEFDPPDKRAKQATDESPDALFNKVRALKLPTKKNSTVTPTLLGYKEATQDAGGLVPGGFVCYVLWNILPGVRLDDEDNARAPLFWSLSRQERDEIRGAFEYTYNNSRKWL